MASGFILSICLLIVVLFERDSLMQLLLRGLEHLVDSLANHRLHNGAVALQIGVASVAAPLCRKTALLVCQSGVVVEIVNVVLLSISLKHYVHLANQRRRANLTTPAKYRCGSYRAKNDLYAVAVILFIYV